MVLRFPLLFMLKMMLLRMWSIYWSSAQPLIVWAN